jgi:hypothetical protein
MRASGFVSDPNAPEISFTLQILDTAEKVDGVSCFAAERVEEDFGQGAIVDIGTGYHASRRNRLSRIAALHDQGEPFHELFFIGGVFHALVEVMGRESLEAFLEESSVPGSAHKTTVGYGVKKSLRVFD